MSVATLPPTSASGRAAGSGTRPGRTGSGTPDPVRAYAQAVVKGKIVAGELVRLACQRHLDDLRDARARGLVWDGDEARRVIALIAEMPLPSGEPFILEPPQQFIVGSLFGWYLSDGSRRFRTAYIEMAKGNGKTPMAAAIGLVGLAFDGRNAAEVYTAGVTRDQAHYLWRDAERMVSASPYLRELVDAGAHNLAVAATDSYMRPVSSEARSLDQKRVHMALIDEVHEHETPLVVEKMRAGTKGDPTALIMEITNSGYDRNSICWQHHQYSRQVLDGTVPNDSWFAYIATIDDGDEWTDERVWPKANPLLDVTVTRRYLREQVQEARDMPAKQSLVQRLNFCIWPMASAGAIELERWDLDTAEPRIPTGAIVYGGLDLSSTSDIASLILLHERPDGILDVLARFWCPDTTVELRSRRDHLPYDLWVRDGWLTETPGDVTDYAAILRDLRTLSERYQIAELGYVRLNATQFVQQAGELTTVVPIAMTTVGMSAATKDWLARITASAESPRLRHGGHPILRWMAGNLVVDTTSDGDMKPSTERSVERIGGQTAAIMALSRLTAPREAPAPEPGILGLYRTMAGRNQPAATAAPRPPVSPDRVLGAHEER